MAERIVSPGVFTIEKDQSFLQRGVSEIGASIVGSTLKGPAQVPTKIGSFSEFQEIFGGYTDESYVPFTVQEYLKNAGTITVTRLLYENGYNLQNGVLAIVAESGSVSEVTHLLHPTQPVSTTGDSNVFEESLFENLDSITLNQEGAGYVLSESYWQLANIVWPILVCCFFAAFISEGIQTGFSYTPGAMKPKFSKLNPENAKKQN